MPDRAAAASPAAQSALPAQKAPSRQCACGTHTVGGTECRECRRGRLQRSADGRRAGAVPAIVHDVLAGAGTPLDGAARRFMESRFGADFSGVRVHADTRAAESARAVGAHAYTVGNRIVFGQDRYRPSLRAGRELLAHELTHVVQQGGSAPPASGDFAIDPSTAAEDEAQRVAHGVMHDTTPAAVPRAASAGLQRMPLALQRGSDTCSGNKVCATGDACAQPDVAGTADLGPSTAWALTVYIDVESSTFIGGLASGDVGHTFVRFHENSGAQYTYGFYPAKDVPNENRRMVPGCVHHPDTSHEACTDDKVNYVLTKEQYTAALAVAQQMCRAPRDYGAKYTCTTFAADVATAAGQTLPPSASEPTTLYYQTVPAIDNPNTLHDNVQEEFRKDPNKKSIWNGTTPPKMRLRPVAPVAFAGDENVPVFRFDMTPIGASGFRWKLFDAANAHYLMRGATGAQPPLDFLSFTAFDSAIIGRKTRDLLKQRGAAAGKVQCTIRYPMKGVADQVVELPVTFA